MILTVFQLLECVEAVSKAVFFSENTKPKSEIKHLDAELKGAKTGIYHMKSYYHKTETIR